MNHHACHRLVGPDGTADRAGVESGVPEPNPRERLLGEARRMLGPQGVCLLGLFVHFHLGAGGRGGWRPGCWCRGGGRGQRRGHPQAVGTGNSPKSGLAVGGDGGVRTKAQGTVKYVWKNCFLSGRDSHSVFKKMAVGCSFYNWEEMLKMKKKYQLRGSLLMMFGGTTLCHLLTLNPDGNH